MWVYLHTRVIDVSVFRTQMRATWVSLPIIRNWTHSCCNQPALVIISKQEVTSRKVYWLWSPAFVWIVVLPANYMCIVPGTCFCLVSVHQTAPLLSCNGRHLIAAYNSFIHPVRMKNWVGLVGWQRKFTGQRPTFYRCITQRYAKTVRPTLRLRFS